MKNIINYTWILLILFIFSCNNNEKNQKNQNTKQDTVTEENQVPETISKLYSDEDLADLSKQELLILRNEIFAKHGYIFNDKDLASHFSQFDWYLPKHKDISEFLSDNDKMNIELIQEYEAKLNNTANFNIFLELFEKINQEPFEISSKNYKSYNSKYIDNKLASKYLNVKIVKSYEGCFSFWYSSIARFDFPDKKHIGLIVKQMTCPVPAVYDEYILFIFDNKGNIIDKVDIAYSRGAAGDFTEASSTFENMTFIKTVTRVFHIGEDSDGYPISETEIQKFKIEFNPKTAKAIETEI